jgi:hypothetical protein
MECGGAVNSHVRVRDEIPWGEPETIRMAEYGVAGAVASGFLALVFAPMAMFFFSVDEPGWGIFTALIVLFFVYIPIIGFRERLVLSPDGIAYRRGLFRRGTIPWRDIESIGVTKNWFKSEFGRALGRLRITSRSGKKLRMPSLITPGGLGEDSAWVVLNEIEAYAVDLGRPLNVIERSDD